MKINWRIIFDVFYNIFTVFLIVSLIVLAYFIGFKSGELFGVNKVREELARLEENVSSKEIARQAPTPIIVKTSAPVAKPKIPNWTGPQLWEEVNKSRVEHGVNPLKQKDELCTIASIRLNELLELGKLDGHEGFPRFLIGDQI